VSPGASTSSDDGGAEGSASPPAPDPRLDAECDGVRGLTARAVLDAVNRYPQQMTATFSRFTYPPGPPAMDHPTPLTLTFRYDNGDARCTPAIPDPPGTPNAGVTPASVELDATVTFATADGLFAETFTAAFSLPGDLVFHGKMPVAQLRGTYAATAAADAAGNATEVVFFGEMQPGTVQYSQGGVVHGRPFAHFEFD
jgi:hypothetical protein